MEAIHAQSFFTIGLGGVFQQVLIYDYFDEEHHYYRLLEDEEEYRVEMERLIDSMNGLLSEEEVRINGEKTGAEVLTVSLDFRGAPELPTLTFYIEFKGRLRKGVNEYLCLYDSGTAEYDYEVFWFFPHGVRILEVEMSGEHEVLGERMLFSWVRRGWRYVGREKIRFYMP